MAVSPAPQRWSEGGEPTIFAKLQRDLGLAGWQPAALTDRPMLFLRIADCGHFWPERGDHSTDRGLYSLSIDFMLCSVNMI